MTLTLLAYCFGLLTVLAPCVLPVLPVVIGGTVAGEGRWRPYVITLSLGVSIFLFSVGLQLLSRVIFINPVWLKTVSVVILIGFGLITLFPQLWEGAKRVLHLRDGTAALSVAGRTPGLWGAILTGAALGPVFNSCSPTYALILSTVLQQQFWYGVWLLLVYVLGLSTIVLLIAVYGGRLIQRLRGAADPRGWFKRLLGVLFILVGVMVWQGWDKQLEAFIIRQGWYIDTTALEETSLSPTREHLQRQKAPPGNASS